MDRTVSIHAGCLYSIHIFFHSLQAFRMPQKIFIKRLDTQLNMWVLEAKNFPPKKKYV